jgi:hypothetical protein
MAKSKEIVDVEVVTPEVVTPEVVEAEVVVPPLLNEVAPDRIEPGYPSRDFFSE